MEKRPSIFLFQLKGNKTNPELLNSQRANWKLEVQRITNFCGCRLFYKKGLTGWGIVIYDRTGVVELSACKLEAIEVNPLLTEALGARWCLQVAINLNLQRVTISSNADTVFKCLNYNLCISAINSIILD
ncbi:isoflavone-7-O-methyltransferase, partial [Trifolium medium]|nr:isoflavone-7-O-methyltransferase [Trifolium medium]